MDNADQKVTGELRNWRKDPLYQLGDRFRYTGNIYNDTHGRFPDGTLIHTSLVVEVIDDVAHTRSGNAYRLLGDTIDIEATEV